ncbi:MAG: four helix bundle protein [Phycisphaerae bacterium]|nr:four helix bundle protein [Phycisphaerae bacterium]
MTEAQQGYRDLVVWQRAVDLVPKVYGLLKRLPVGERYALGDQLRRAVVSVAANVAEGQARQHRKEFLQHLWIARGSLAETETLLVVGHRLGYWPEQDLECVLAAMAEVRRPLQGLINRMQA